MINIHDIMETINMISEENLDIRTITMGISLLDCCDSDIEKSCQKVYDKITLVSTEMKQEMPSQSSNEGILYPQPVSQTRKPGGRSLINMIMRSFM